MSVTVPSTDAQSFALQTAITNLTTAITQNAGNGKLVADLTAEKASAQSQLVIHLLSVVPPKLNAATILSTCTYGT